MRHHVNRLVYFNLNADISFEKFKVWPIDEMHDVVRVASRQVVKTYHFVATRDQGFAQMRPEKPAPPVTTTRMYSSLRGYVLVDNRHARLTDRIADNIDYLIRRTLPRKISGHLGSPLIYLLV